MANMNEAEKNALSVSYEVQGARVKLDLNFVKAYLVRGNPEKITDQEVLFFINTCKMQRLNPLVSGEVYLIKFGSEPAQMVVGKGAYLRRAYENPDYICKEDGIVVQRGDSIEHKEGTCLYPGEKLIGGWCRVYFMRGGKERTTYKEVALVEYDKGQANWKTKPSTMINKVAISQCVRDAFPKDYEGLYSEEEMIASGAIPANATQETAQIEGSTGAALPPAPEDPVATQDQRKVLFTKAHSLFGETSGNKLVKQLLSEEGLESTHGMKVSALNRIVDKLDEMGAGIINNPTGSAEG